MIAQPNTSIIILRVVNFIRNWGIFLRVRKKEGEGESVREIERDKREEEKVLFLIMFRSYDLT